MTFKRKWPYAGSLSDAELAEALQLAFSDPEMQRLLDNLRENVEAVRLENAERDRELEELVGAKALRMALSKFPAAGVNDGREIAQQLFAEVARRIESKRAEA